MTSADYCPCGGLVTSVVVDTVGAQGMWRWVGKCEAGHDLYFKDLASQGSLVGQKQGTSFLTRKGRSLKTRRTHQ